jgi:hypothetical protein
VCSDLVGFNTQRPDKPLVGVGIEKNSHNSGPAFDLFIQEFQHISTLQMLMMRLRQAIETQRLTDVGLRPAGQTGAYLPAHLPSQTTRSHSVS